MYLIYNNSGSYIPEERHFQQEMLKKKKKEIVKKTLFLFPLTKESIKTPTDALTMEGSATEMPDFAQV